MRGELESSEESLSESEDSIDPDQEDKIDDEEHELPDEDHDQALEEAAELMTDEKVPVPKTGEKGIVWKHKDHNRVI